MSFIASGREATSFSKAPRCLVRADDIFERLGCMLRRDIGIASNNLSRFHSGIWPYGSSSLGLSGSTDSERCSKRTQPARLCKAWSWETIRKEVKHPSKTWSIYNSQWHMAFACVSLVCGLRKDVYVVLSYYVVLCCTHPQEWWQLANSTLCCATTLDSSGSRITVHGTVHLHTNHES